MSSKCPFHPPSFTLTLAAAIAAAARATVLPMLFEIFYASCILVSTSPPLGAHGVGVQAALPLRLGLLRGLADMVDDCLRIRMVV